MPDSQASLVSFRGPASETAALLRAFHASPAHDELEALSVTPDAATLRVSWLSHESSGGRAMLPFDRLIRAFGPEAVFEPVLFREGRARVRLLLPTGTDTQRVLLALRGLQKSCGWQDFRVVRVANLEVKPYVDSMRRILMPEQEDILRLALQLGYYHVPKRATLDTIAKSLGLSVSPVHKRLKAIEGVLITSYVEPHAVVRPDFRRRPRRGTALPAPAPLLDVALRVRCPETPLQRFTSRAPGSTAMFQHLSVNRITNEASALVVAVGNEQASASLRWELERHPASWRVEVISEHGGHLALRLHTSMPSPAAARDHPYSWFPSAGQHDLLLKPTLFEGSDMYVRFLLLRPHTQDELLERIDGFAKAGGWEEHEILAVRPFASDAGNLPTPPPDQLTPRQDEVLKIAYALGYYKTPRSCTLESIASTLGVSANAIHKNLAAAEFNVITRYLSSGF